MNETSSLGDAWLDLTSDKLAGPGHVIHRWFGRRGALTARMAIALTASPELVADSAAIERLLGADLADTGRLIGKDLPEGRPVAVLDLCSGVGTVSEVALSLGFAPTAVDLHPIAVLSGRCLLTYPPLYAAPDRESVGVGTDRTWCGLAGELRHWAGEVLAAAKTAAGELWLGTVSAVECSWIVRCPLCGDESPLSARDTRQEMGDGPIVRPGSAKCNRCGASFRFRIAEFGRWTPVALVSDDLRSALELPTNVADVLTGAEYPASINSKLDEAWAYRRSEPIPYRVGLTARQACLLESFRRSIWRTRESMAEAGYAPDRIVALSTYLALAASNLVDYLCTGTSWRPGRIMPALGRFTWGPGYKFIEAGGDVLERIWQRRIAAMGGIIEDNSALPKAARVLSGNMAELSIEPGIFDLIIWDPPFYDNIDYDQLAEPWTAFLRGVVGELDASLRWEAPKSPGTASSIGRFDPNGYEQALSSAAGEVVRAARPGARIGIFWVSRKAQELQRFVDLLQSRGLELIQTVAFRTEQLPNGMEQSGPIPYLLVLRALKQAGGPSGRVIDAERLLELSSSGQRSLNAGLAGVLTDAWDEDEYKTRIPEFRMERKSQQLAEFVAAQPDPADLLRDLGTKQLRHAAQRLGVEPEKLAGLDAAMLARLVLSHLGFTVPSAPAFSIGAALRDADRARSRLLLADSQDEIAGSGMTAAEAVERILRFSVVTWCTHIRGDEWNALIRECISKDALSFGDWVNLFTKIPQDAAPNSDIYGHIQRIFKKQRAAGTLQPLVWPRNRIAHPDADQDWVQIKSLMDERLDAVIRMLRILLDQAALPIVLQPIEEIRDRFSRYRIRMLDHDEREKEFITAGPIDLTKPKILLRGNLRPREVDPELLDADIIEQRMGLKAKPLLRTPHETMRVRLLGHTASPAGPYASSP